MVPGHLLQRCREGIWGLGEGRKYVVWEAIAGRYGVLFRRWVRVMELVNDIEPKSAQITVKHGYRQADSLA